MFSVHSQHQHRKESVFFCFFQVNHVWSKCVQKTKPFRLLTQEIATKVRPTVKSLSPSSTTTFSSVRSWLLCIVIPQASIMIRGHCQCVHVKSFLTLVSHRATAGTNILCSGQPMSLKLHLEWFLFFEKCSITDSWLG